MYYHSGELTVILIIIWWLQKLGKDSQQGNKPHKRLMSKGLISISLVRWRLGNMFEALVNLNDSEDINRAWENIRKNIKISAKEALGLHRQKQHKPWFDEECSQV
jgi:hypothetical protein